MIYNDYILYISLLLSIIILFSLLYGCSFRKYRENFETDKSNKEDDEKASDKSEDTKKTKKSADTTTDKSKNKYDSDLSQDEIDLKKKILGGDINEDKMNDLLKSGKVTDKNVKNILESFQKQLEDN